MPAPSNIVALLDRLDYVRGLGIEAARAERIHPARLCQLLDEGAIMTVQHIADLEPVRRTAILVAQAADLETQIADATLGMFEKYMGSLFSKAQNRDERRFQATKRDVAKTLLLFRRTIAALKQAQETGENGLTVVDREVGLKRLDAALPVIGSVADVADQDILVTAAERYSVLRRFSPRFLAAFRFQSSIPQDPVLAAIEILKTMDRDGIHALPKRPPASFLPPKWRKLIFTKDAPDRRLYETAVLATLRERLRGSDIWVAGSRDYRAFEDYLLPAVKPLPSVGIGNETDPGRYIAARAAALHEQLNFVMARAARGELDGVEIEDGKLYIARTKPAVPDAARDLAIQLERDAAAGAHHRGSERGRCLDRFCRPLHASAHRQSGAGQAGTLGCGARRRHQSRPRPHGRCVARPQLPSPGQRGAMAYQRRQLRRRPRRHHQRASQASDGGDLG